MSGFLGKPNALMASGPDIQP